MTTPATFISDVTMISGDVQSTVTTAQGNGTDRCEANNNLFTIAFIPFKVIVTLMNLMLFTAVVRDRKRLQRQNYTFTCVMSTLLSNTVYLFISIWLTVDNYPQHGADPQEGVMTKEKYLWLISEAALASIVLGIGANVTSLTYVTLDSVFYVGRGGTAWGANTGHKQSSVTLKGRIAKFLVFLSWVVPIGLTSLTFGWNCAKECRCPSNNFVGEHCPRTHNCSHMWAPLKTGFLIVIAAFWMLEVFGLLICVILGIRSHFRSLKRPAGNTMLEQIEPSHQVQPGSDEQRKEREAKTMLSPRKQNSVMTRRFNSRLKFGTYLTVLLVFCSIPATVSSLVDAYMDKPPYQGLILMSGLFMFFYCACCPILMWRFLPSLRSSTLKLKVSIVNALCRKPRDKMKPRGSVSGKS